MHSFQAGVTAEVPVRFDLVDCGALEPPTAAIAIGGSPVLEIPRAFLWIQHGTNRLCDASSWSAIFFLLTMTLRLAAARLGAAVAVRLLPYWVAQRSGGNGVIRVV